MVDVVVVNYNNYKEVISYIERVKNMMQVSHIVVVDNCSTDRGPRLCLPRQSFLDSPMSCLCERTSLVRLPASRLPLALLL